MHILFIYFINKLFEKIFFLYINPTLDGGGQILPPLAFYALELSILIRGVPDLVQFIFCSYNVSSERSGPKGCPRKKMECDF